MYEYDEEAKKVDFSHNPFSMPQGGLEALESKDPLDILAFQYDIVCNGVELSLGRDPEPPARTSCTRRSRSPATAQADVDTNFSGMINAFKFGAPPHGGSAPGIDRIVMLLAGEPNIREVVLFPMNQKAEDLMMNAPGEVTAKQLRELNIRIVDAGGRGGARIRRRSSRRNEGRPPFGLSLSKPFPSLGARKEALRHDSQALSAGA